MLFRALTLALISFFTLTILLACKIDKRDKYSDLVSRLVESALNSNNKLVTTLDHNIVFFELMAEDLLLIQEPYSPTEFVKSFRHQRPVDVLIKTQWHTSLLLNTFLARAGNRYAQYRYAEHFSAGSQQQRYWLERASANGYAPAIIMLSKLYVAQQRKQKAHHLLSENINLSSNIELAYIKLSISLNLQPNAWLPNLESLLQSEPDNNVAQQIMSDYKAFYRASDINFKKEIIKSQSKCRYPIHLVAADRQELKELSVLLFDVIHQNELNHWGVCLAGKHWLIGHDALDDIIQNTPTTLIRFKPQLTRANYYKGIISLPFNTTTHVLKHELGHVVGFEDEYQLPDKYKTIVCRLEGHRQVNQLGKNVVVVDPELRFVSQSKAVKWIEINIPWSSYINNKQNWIKSEGSKYKLDWVSESLVKVDKKLGKSGGIGLFFASTCQGEKNIALKPTYRESFMFKHTYDIPEVYNNLIN